MTFEEKMHQTIFRRSANILLRNPKKDPNRTAEKLVQLTEEFLPPKSFSTIERKEIFSVVKNLLQKEELEELKKYLWSFLESKT